MTSIFVFVYLMRLRAPSSTRTDTLCPYTTIFRSISISTRSILMKIDSNELAAIHAAPTRMDIPHSQLRLSEAYQARSAQEIGRAHVELQSLMRSSYAVFCLKKKINTTTNNT